MHDLLIDLEHHIPRLHIQGYCQTKNGDGKSRMSSKTRSPFLLYSVVSSPLSRCIVSFEEESEWGENWTRVEKEQGSTKVKRGEQSSCIANHGLVQQSQNRFEVQPKLMLRLSLAVIAIAGVKIKKQGGMEGRKIARLTVASIPLLQLY